MRVLGKLEPLELSTSMNPEEIEASSCRWQICLLGVAEEMVEGRK